MKTLNLRRTPLQEHKQDVLKLKKVMICIFSASSLSGNNKFVLLEDLTSKSPINTEQNMFYLGLVFPEIHPKSRTKLIFHCLQYFFLSQHGAPYPEFISDVDIDQFANRYGPG